MVKDETFIWLAGIGIVGYGLLKSDFFKGLGGIGTGVGEAVSSGGNFVKETFIQGGETIRDVGQLIQTTTEGAGKIIYEVGDSGADIVREVGGLGVDILNEETGARGIWQNIGGTLVSTTGFLRSEIKQNLGRLSRVDDFIYDNVPTIIQGAGTAIRDKVSAVKATITSLPSAIPSAAGVVVGAVSNVAKKAAGFLKTEGVSGGSITLPNSSNVKVVYDSLGQGMSVAPTTTTKTSTLRDKITNTISTAKTTTKSLLSSIGSKIRGIF